jgi:hypothetical protein
MLLRGVFHLKGKTSMVFVPKVLLCFNNLGCLFPKNYRFGNPCFATNVSKEVQEKKLVELDVTRKKLQDIELYINQIAGIMY